MSTLSYIGLIGGIASFLGYFPYAKSVIEGKAQPERASWLIWTLSSALILLSYFAVGARTTIWVPLAYVLGSAFITVLAFIYGKEGWGTLEKLALLVAIISAIRWVYFDKPLLALVVNVAIGLIGYIPKIIHPFSEKNRQESLLAWGLYSLGALFNVIAISPWIPIIYVVPVIMFIMNGLVFGLKVIDLIRQRVPKSS